MNIDYKEAFFALLETLDAEYTPITEKDVDTEWGLEARRFAGALEIGGQTDRFDLFVAPVHDENLDQALDTFYKAHARGEK